MNEMVLNNEQKNPTQTEQMARYSKIGHSIEIGTTIEMLRVIHLRHTYWNAARHLF